MVCTPLALFPHASVAVHVLAIVPVVPPQPVRFATSVYVISGKGSVSSTAVASPVSCGSVDAPHAPVVSGGTINEGDVSSTKISVVAAARHPKASHTVTV